LLDLYKLEIDRIIASCTKYFDNDVRAAFVPAMEWKGNGE